MQLISNSQSVLDFISQPWHWSVSGAAIALIVFLMTWMGRSFGVSSTFNGVCTLAGAGKVSDYFKTDIKGHYWRFAFVIGGVIGGFIASNFLQSPASVDISQATIEGLAQLGISYPEGDASLQGFVPTEVFNFSSIKGLFLALAGGFLVGFGARYGDGCTSGHAITGLAHFQLPSLITVIGFFIGGLLMTHILMPLILG